MDIKARQLLLTPKYEHWLSKCGGEFVLTIPQAKRFGDLLADHLSRKGRVRSGSFSASSRGFCERAQVFGYIGMPQRVFGNSLRSLIFIDGKMKHLVWQYIGLEAGALTDIEVPIDADALDKWRLMGSMDGGDDFNGIGLELKSTSAFGYYVANGPSLAHMLQIHSYLLGSSRYEVFSLIYLDTTTREWREHVIRPDKRYMSMVKAELGRLNDAVVNRQLPEVQDGCKAGKSKAFRDCGYSHICLGCRSYDEAEAIASVVIQGVQGGGRNPQPGSNGKRVRRVRRRPPG